MNFYDSHLNYPLEWSIKKEPIYRLLDDVKWMENFFNDGELMISCLSNFKNYPDEMIGDKDEGDSLIAGTNENGDLIGIKYDSGDNAFIMSTTTELTEKVKKDFNAKCAIKINNPSYFGIEITRKLPFAHKGYEGHCIYAESRVQMLDREIEKNKAFQSIDFHNDPFASQKLATITRDYELFLKLDKYKHQKEYRMIWFTKNKVDKSMVINCPEVIKYCEKVYF